MSGAGASTIPHRLLFDNQTFGTFLAYWGDRRAEPLDVSIRLTIEGTPVVQDLLAATDRAVEGFSRDASTRTTRLSAPLTGGPMLIDFNRGAVDVFGDSSRVTPIADCRWPDRRPAPGTAAPARRLVRNYTHAPVWSSTSVPPPPIPGTT